jgi:hypothetical protein
LSFPHIAEYFSIEQLLVELAVEALNISMLGNNITNGSGAAIFFGNPNGPFIDPFTGKTGPAPSPAVSMATTPVTLTTSFNF